MKLIFAGTGGYGVKFLGSLLSKILMLKGFNVVFTFDYDAASRGGDIIGYVIYSNEKIGNVTIDKADILLKFSEVNKKVKGKEVIEFNFDCQGYRPNMVALGFMLKKIGIDISKEELREFISKDTEKNVEGIIYGQNI